MALSRIEQVGLQVLKGHQWLYEKTGGKVGHKLLFGNPTLLLHTVGARTGQQRTNALTYGRDGDAWLVVASNGGAPKAPAWLHNLRANPDADINVGPRRTPVRARVTLPDDPDYARRWEIVNGVNANRYTAYQKRTTRQIPIVELRPR
ncbi:deazaflavin-dependent oxidoreductase (nitroreductase family) [Knoellia remsis]|uniref:Deazaflavin-dependent oxidoreductase (Nitroreductase family) n=1 Tax=Knoellia remsis TaxID=407159 RepID=A0A2T0UHV7_9MICO|nr:nitroreductase family deazaflavin-dependent oxidoreductase [Knoellia remsis]PRY57520.1 deazaflavin-dependent oxidoreductase (nitroreductase family) [Knoellia remsis]